VGVGLGVVVIAALGFFFWRRSRKRRQQQQQNTFNRGGYQAGSMPAKEPLMHQALGTPIQEAPSVGGRYDGRRVGEEMGELTAHKRYDGGQDGG